MFFRWNGFEVRQDPQSHHLLLYYSPLNLEPEGVDVHHASFGTWTCAGGERAGEVCEPTDLAFCGTGVCASELRPSFACVGFGPPSGRPAEITGGAPQAQTNFLFPGGVYQQLPLKGVMYWNTHAFNVTSRDHVMNGRVNYYFAEPEQQDNQACRISDFSAIFRPNNPPFTRETFCNDHVFPVGSRVFQLFGAQPQARRALLGDRSERAADLRQLFVQRPGDPAVRSAARVRFAERRGAHRSLLRDVQQRRRSGRSAGHRPGDAGVARPTGGAEVHRQVQARRLRRRQARRAVHATTRTATRLPGAGDGWCDACNITGGESTENEMFVLFGAQYVDPSVPGADLSCLPYPEGAP